MTESLEFEWVLRPDSNPVIEHYVLHFRGEARTWDDDVGEEVLVGRIAGHRVDLALARHDGISLDELLDSISHDITEFRDTAFADSNCYVPLPHVESSQPRQHCECLVDSISHDITEFRDTAFADSNCYVPLPHVESSQPRQHCECLVYIDEVIVDSTHRGKGIGTELFHRMSESIDLEYCVIGLKAFPISKEPGAPRSAEEIERVKQFYVRLGFHPVGQDYMIKDASQCGTKQKRTSLRNKDAVDG